MLASRHARPLHPLPRVRKRPRRDQGDRAGGSRRSARLEPRTPRLHRPRRTPRCRRARRRGRTPAAPARPGARCARARPGAACRVQPGGMDFRGGVAAGAGRRAVPAGTTGADARCAADGGRGGADLVRARLARRADRSRRRRRLGAPAQRAPAAGRRRPPPVRARARLRTGVRRAAAFARRLSAAMGFFASCGKGLEYLLADELQALGCAGANAEGTLADAQRAVLWSRLASRVLWPLAEFDCPDEDALYAGARAIAWPEHLGPGATLAVDAHVSGAAITHARYAAQRVKDAVVDVMREHTGTRPDVDLEA